MEEEVESGAEQARVFFCFVWSNGKASLSPRSLCSFSPPSDPPGRSVRYRTTPAPKREAEAGSLVAKNALLFSFRLNSISPWRASPRRPLHPRAPCFSPRRGRTSSPPRRQGQSGLRRGSSAGPRTGRARATRRRARAKRTTKKKQRWRKHRGDDGDALVVAQRPTTTRGQMSTPGRSRPSRGSTAASWSGASSSRPAWLTGESGACTQPEEKRDRARTGEKRK